MQTEIIISDSDQEGYDQIIISSKSNGRLAAISVVSNGNETLTLINRKETSLIISALAGFLAQEAENN